MAQGAIAASGHVHTARLVAVDAACGARRAGGSASVMAAAVALDRGLVCRTQPGAAQGAAGAAGVDARRIARSHDACLCQALTAKLVAASATVGLAPGNGWKKGDFTPAGQWRGLGAHHLVQRHAHRAAWCQRGGPGTAACHQFGAQGGQCGGLRRPPLRVPVPMASRTEAK